MTGPAQLLLTCEHGGRDVPDELAVAFDRPLARQYLGSHRGWDPGALEAAEYFSANLQSPLIQSTVSRLIVDLNRSLEHPELFSPFTRPLAKQTRDSILRQHYHAYRNRVTRQVQAILRRGLAVVHVSVHSFTPVFRGSRRRIDIGLLFDPARSGERNLCRSWKSRLVSQTPNLRVAMNQPYLGVDDGLTTALRAKFRGADYVGIELELNNQFVRRTDLGRTRFLQAISTALDQALADA